MWQIILIILGLLLTTLGVVCIFDARLLTKKLFSFGDQNSGVLVVKTIGIFLFCIGMLIIFFNLT